MELNEENRLEFVEAIDNLDPKGGTCLGSGLMQGMTVNQI